MITYLLHVRLDNLKLDLLLSAYSRTVGEVDHGEIPRNVVRIVTIELIDKLWPSACRGLKVDARVAGDDKSFSDGLLDGLLTGRDTAGELGALDGLGIACHLRRVVGVWRAKVGRA